jgi:hypothetical protein
MAGIQIVGTIVFTIWRVLFPLDKDNHRYFEDKAGSNPHHDVILIPSSTSLTKTYRMQMGFEMKPKILK